MAARRPFWKWHRWKSIGFCLWPPSTCIWNLKLKFQSKLDLCSGNHVVYRQTNGQTDGQGESSIPPPSNFVGRGYNQERLFSTLCKYEYIWLYNRKSFYRHTTIILTLINPWRHNSYWLNKVQGSGKNDIQSNPFISHFFFNKANLRDLKAATGL